MSHSFVRRKIEIPDFGEIELNLEDPSVDTRDYFLMAVRKNNVKRNFLFVSQLLGKHIPVQPGKLLGSCKKLSMYYARDKSLGEDQEGRFVCAKKTLVIGFAETATAMGHAIYDCFAGECVYVNTTRDKVTGYEFAFEFEEEHCHAKEQLFFLRKKRWIEDAEEVLIVDDEVTTGKTIKSIIEQIDGYFPGKSYAVFTFLDWRNEGNVEVYRQLSVSKDITIKFYSFVKGSIEKITISDNTVIEEEVSVNESYNLEKNGWKLHRCDIDSDYVTSANSGIDPKQREIISSVTNSVVEQLTPFLTGKKRAVIGTGEFMYIPLLCAGKFPGMNYFNATTRSPIIPNARKDYGIKSAFYFVCPYEPERNEYLYNQNIMECDEVVLFLEKEVPPEQLGSILLNLDKAGYSSKHIVFLKGNKGE